MKNGAGDWIRTRDLLITNQLLYQLSYTSLNKDGPALGPTPTVTNMAPGDVLLSHGETPHYHWR